MASMLVSTPTTASPQECWAVISDFANIADYNPDFAKSFMLTEGEIGVGSKRQCDLQDGISYIREEILEWEPGKYHVISVYEGTMSISDAETKLGVVPGDPDGSQLYIEFTYKAKFGLFGIIINALLLKRAMRTMLTRVVEALAHQIEEKAAKANKTSD